MIERFLFVTTDMFESVTPGANFINPRCFGEDFATWLHARLTDQQPTVDAPTQEDWGWLLLIRQGTDVFTLALGIMDEAIGKAPAQWRLGISFEKSGIRSWFERHRPRSLTACSTRCGKS